MRTSCLLLLSGVVALAGCGGDGSDSDGRSRDQGASQTTAGQKPAVNKGTTVVLAGSDVGRMLFDSKRQAIYIFERDEAGKSNCYGDCAEAWPPVYAKGKPQAGKGVDRSLLGTTKRRDGKLQVTYGGKPLYYYAHEGPGEVKCHNVELNGGYWWAVGADGRRLQ